MRPIETKKISAVEIKPFFDSLTQEELTSKEFLTEFLLKRVGIRFRVRDFSIKEGEYLQSEGFGMKIWPDEFARFLIFLYEHKSEIKSFLEFGTAYGGSFFVIDSYLRSINPDMGKSVTIDKNNYRSKEMEDYQNLYPEVSYCNMLTAHFILDRKYDLCFIDAKHNYGAVKYDYDKVKDNSKFIALHDILTENKRKPDQKCVRHLWQELEAENKLEIVTDDPRITFMSGIGVVWTKSKN